MTQTDAKPQPAPRSNTDNTVDSAPPLARLFPLGLQHVLALYAGAVAVPLIVGGALGCSSAGLAFLISGDLFTAGIATIVQSACFWRLGVRLPWMPGVTFPAVGPMTAVGQQHGITTIVGAVIEVGLTGVKEGLVTDAAAHARREDTVIAARRVIAALAEAGAHAALPEEDTDCFRRSEDPGTSV